MFATLDEQVRIAETGSTSRLRQFGKFAVIALLTGVLYGGLYLGLLVLNG